MLKGESIRRLCEKLDAGWVVVEEHHLRKEYAFRNFQEALEFTNRIGAVAEEQGYHPDIRLSWGKVIVELWTLAVLRGLLEPAGAGASLAPESGRFVRSCGR